MTLHLYEWFINNSAEILIGTSALILTTVTVYQTRKHNRLSVTPHLDTFLDHSNNEIILYLLNNGIGPAKIDDVTLFIDGSPHKGDLKKIAFNQIQNILLNGLTVVNATHLDSSFSLLNGSSIPLFKVTIASDQYSGDEIENNLKRIHLLINYSSFYDVKYKHDTRETFWNDLNIQPKNES